MCDIIYADHLEIDTIKGLLSYLGINLVQLVKASGYRTIEIENCLCQIDVDATLRALNMDFTRNNDTGDYLILKDKR